MSDLLAKYQELSSLPPGLHWFCPLSDDAVAADGASTPNNGVLISTDDGSASNVEHRRQLVTACLGIFAYDGEDVKPFQRSLTQKIDAQLGRCYMCITEYYKLKRGMIDGLRHDYEEEEVEVLVELFDKQDFARILRGLARVSETLEAVEPRRRGKGVLDETSESALFEALSCDAFLQHPDFVKTHLEKPMTLVQTNRKFHLTSYVPAATYFLFDPDPSRCIWAMQIWSKIRVKMSKDDFNFAVRDPLAKQMRAIAESNTDILEIQRFWCGMHLIVDRLDKDLVTHCLLALDVDICRMSLEHLQFATPALRFVLRTIQGLLEVAPQTFWDSMGAIPPTTVIEQIFNNAQYDRYMMEAQKGEDYANSPLKDMLTWIEPFMTSLQPSQKVQACRSLSFQLFDRLQEPRFASHARVTCKKTGLLLLQRTLSSCNRTEDVLSQIGRMIATECLEVVGSYIQRVMAMIALPEGDPSRQTLEKTALDTIEAALALECKALRTDQETLKLENKLPTGFSSYAPAIWDAVLHRLDRSNLRVAAAALSGVTNLTGLEEFHTNRSDTSKERAEFNATLRHLTQLICQMLEQINDSSPADLDTLFGQARTRTALVALLFSPHPGIYEAGVSLIKTISSEVARREAIGHLLRSFFDTTLNSFSEALGRIAENKTWASCPRMLKTLEDALDILSNSQNGLLRTRALASAVESHAVRHFWEKQWDALKVIYEMTEEWGRQKVSDNDTLKEFCRDTMQLSDRLFDQYNVFASALTACRDFRQDEVHKGAMGGSGEYELLNHPAKTMQSMVKWLRLRDPYLASTSASLTQKVLDRLSDAKMKLGERPVKFLEYVIRGDPGGRTHLTAHEKAEILRALERNIGRTVLTQDTESERSDSSRAASKSRDSVTPKKKAGAIDFDRWNSKARQSIDLVSDDEDQRPASDLRVGELRGLQVYRASGLARGNREATTASRGAIPGSSISKHRAQQEASQLAFRERREKEKQEKKKRDAEALAKVKGRSTGSEGSKTRGLGVEGKDHAPKGSSMMVSSESESDSQEDDYDDLFGPPPKVSDAVRDYHLSRLKAKEYQGPVKKTKQVRSAKDMRARLAPDLTALHRTILGWEYFHTGDLPPATTRQDYKQVPKRFRTPLDYESVFEPLLILEAWNGFLKSREEMNIKNFDIKVANRMTVDSFVEVSTTMPLAEGQELGMGEADVVLLSKAESPMAEADQPHCLARVHRITRKKGAMEISYRINPGSSLTSAMVPNATIHGARILSITPLEREYGALQGLKYFDLCNEIIEAKPSPLLKYSNQQLSPLAATYKVNGAQAKAIKSAIDNDAFTLIQGPPGSGKTKTIVAIVGALLSESFKDNGVAIGRPQGAEPVARQAAPVTKKLLVCAPSNAAVDELVMRFKEGVRTVRGEDRRVSIVRLGRSDAINSNVKDVTLEELVNAKLNVTGTKQSSTGDDINSLMMAHKAACEEFNALRSKADEMKAQGKSATADQERDFEILKRKRQQLSNNIDTARDNGNIASRDADINRRQIQQGILDGAHIICATLSGSGHDMFQNLNIEFETVVIDEAAQSIELSALIPLKYGCSKCILVGDPKQLPPTVLSREAARFQYEQSLFVRMQANHPGDVHLLDTQYRMHPEISSFPSKAFYDGKLLDGPDMLPLRTKPWHRSEILGPYRFFDVQGTHQSAPRGHSLINIAEIEVALKLYERLTTDCRRYHFQNKIGIITPYKSQLRELKARFAQTYGRTILETVEFNTTDAFQGRESEVIIFSCVRASVNKSIGFLDDIRRMNVGITRAKSSLWVLGNSQSLMNGEFWAKLIQDAKARDRYSGGNLVGMLQKPLQELTNDASQPAASNDPDETSDVEMVDAHSNGKSTSSTSRTSSMSQPRWAPHAPAGGANGLNPQANCGRCGSAEHMSHQCNHPVAAITTKPKCPRCGEESHPKDQCTAERCFTCGELGHNSKLCFSKKVLSQQERSRLMHQERSHQRFLQMAPANKAQRQLGDHDKQVPAVRASATTPPPAAKALKPSSTTDGKRKREGSPPAGAPRGPRDSGLPLNSGPRPPPQAPKKENSKPVAAPPPEPVHGSEKKLAVNRTMPLGNVRPPAKKRKEADPFIRPKRR